uniref:Uncharacterized protein n=1 Tax=Caenorhabditis japonica TaxID=281687 RepID=A0A8R1HGC3_CAEJA
MAIIRGCQMGLDMPTFAKQFKTSKSVIWATLNAPNLSKATGRPLKTSSQDDRIIVRMSKKNLRLTSTDINSELKNQYGVQLSVQGHCQKTSAPRFSLQKAPSEQTNDSGEEPFSSTEVGKGSSALGWNKVLWSDESKYLMIGTDGVTLVRRPGDKRNDPKYQVSTVKHGGGNVMMWGCFHATGVGSLIRITGTMESYMYKDILEKEMLPSGKSQMGRGWLFQQDNDPKHSSHFFRDWFAQHRVNVMTWPSQSPDLNPSSISRSLLEAAEKRATECEKKVGLLEQVLITRSHEDTNTGGSHSNSTSPRGGNSPNAPNPTVHTIMDTPQETGVLIETTGRLRKIIWSTTQCSVDLLGYRTEKTTSKQITVTAEECSKMKKHQRCNFGDLVAINGVSKTENPLIIDWPSAPFSIFKGTQTAETTNCFMVRTHVATRFGKDVPESPAGSMDRCRYSDGFCTTRDGGASAWDPTPSAQCEYVAWKSFKGFMSQDIWLIKDREVALTFNDSSSRTLSCGVKLIVTDQGYGVNLAEKTKRSTENTANKEWSVDGKAVLDSSVNWFARNFLDWCHNLNSLTASTLAAAASNPTLAARQMLRKENVHARFVSKGYLAVQTCSALAPDSYRFVAFKNLCYSKPAIEVVLPEGNTSTTFLDLATNEITNRAYPVECSLTTNFQFIVNDTLASLNPFTLELKETKNFHAENDLHSSNSLISQALQEPLIFHNMVIGSISEEIHENHYNEIWAALQGSPEAITKIISRNSDPASGSIAGGKLEQIISFCDRAKWLGGVIFTVWTLIVDTLVTGVILALIFMYFATGFLSVYLPFSRSMPKHELERVVTPRPTLDEYEAIRNRLATPRINALETSSREFFTAQIPIKANGIHCRALVDTGASFTVASEDMCCLLGIGQLLEPTSHTAIGSFMLFQDTHFTKGKCIPSGPQSYEFILGNDLLQRLPKFYLDYTKGVFEIGEDKLPLGQQRNASIFPSRHAVHVMKDTVIPARSESFVRCIVPGVAQTADLVLLSQTNTLSSQDLVIAPAVFSANFVNLLVTNPTNEPKILYANTKAASATEFYLTTDRGRKIIMEVDHSETVTGALRVHTRFATVNKPTSKETMDLLNAQVTATQTKELHPGWLRLFPENDFLSGVPRDSSAWKLAKAVADGGRLHRRPPCDTSLPQVCDFLNDPQREYCQMHLLDQNAATLANSPPGVGKTVMISAAAIAASSIFPGKLNIICGVTNASASEAVVKLAELETNNPVRFTRLISEQNRQRQRDSTHSDADYPELWKRVLAVALRRSDDSALNGCRYDVKIAQNAMFHLKKARAPVPPLKSKDLLKVSSSAQFFSVADSFANQWAPFANQVAKVQVDEASQLPLFALIALLATFPNAKFGLVGDHRQLPPFSDQEVYPLHHQIAIGNLLKEADRNHRFPATFLNVVHRCPNLITHIISRMFYPEDLQSVRSPRERNQYARALGLPDRYPLHLIYTTGEETVSGTSAFSRSEAQAALQIARDLRGTLGTPPSRCSELDRMTELLRKSKTADIQEDFMDRIEEDIRKLTTHVNIMTNTYREVTPVFSRQLIELKEKNDDDEKKNRMGKYDRFLKPVEEGRKQCTLCDHKFNKQQDSATNLYIHHFSKKHPSEYAHINGKREKSDDVLDQPLVKKMAQATIIESFQNFLPDGVKTEEGHRAITQFLCVTNQSLNMVNCQGFINMIKVISPKLVLKSRTHFTRYEVPKLYEEYERRLMMELRQVENIAISFDGWSDSSNKHECLGVLVHFVKDSKLNFRLIGVIDISHQSHTGIFLFEKIKHNLEHFGIEEKVKVIVRDGARNVVKAADQFRIPHYDCVAHKLHLATKIAIESFPGLLESLEKIRKICSKLNKSSTARREWNELHDLLEIPVLFLKKYTEIRWSSAHAVFERTLKSRDPLKLILLEHDDWPQLTDADWKLMETALEMLQPIAEAVKLVQVNT